MPLFLILGLRHIVIHHLRGTSPFEFLNETLEFAYIKLNLNYKLNKLNLIYH